MNGLTNERNEPEEEAFACEISDEALETAADTSNGKGVIYTFYFCTYMNMCPCW